MGYHLTEPYRAPAKVAAKNRVMGFRIEIGINVRKSAPQPVELHRENHSTVTKPASGIPYWLSRDPIGERGGLNLYGFVGNDGVNQWDYLGLDAYTWDDDGDLEMEPGWLARGEENPSRPRFPAKEPRDVSCCNKEWRDKGEKELNRIHRAIKSRLKACSLDPTDGEGPASCVNIGEKVHGDFTTVNEKLACWTCVLERRYKRTILLGRADHWAIVCQSYKPDKSIDKKIVFDLWKPKFSGKTPEDGFYEEYPNRWENDGNGSQAGPPAGRLERYPQPPDPGVQGWEPGAWADTHLEVIGE